MSELSPLAAQIKALREEAGLSVRGMAKELGWITSSYGHYESKKLKREYLPADKAKPMMEAMARHGIDPARVWQLTAESKFSPENHHDTYRSTRLSPASVNHSETSVTRPSPYERQQGEGGDMQESILLTLMRLARQLNKEQVRELVEMARIFREDNEDAEREARSKPRPPKAG